MAISAVHPESFTATALDQTPSQSRSSPPISVLRESTCVPPTDTENMKQLESSLKVSRYIDHPVGGKVHVPGCNGSLYAMRVRVVHV